MDQDVEAGLRRLQESLGQLERAVVRRFAAEKGRADLETELQVMQDDRVRLAVELEGATARLGSLEAATDHVGRRVRAAAAGLQEVLGSVGTTRGS